MDARKRMKTRWSLKITTFMHGSFNIVICLHVICNCKGYNSNISISKFVIFKFQQASTSFPCNHAANSLYHYACGISTFRGILFKALTILSKNLGTWIEDVYRRENTRRTFLQIFDITSEINQSRCTIKVTNFFFKFQNKQFAPSAI